MILGLLVPPAGSPFGAWAQNDQVADGVSQPGVPYWQVLRPADEERWTGVDLEAVHFPTARVGYAVGGLRADGEGAPYGVVLRTEDGGDNWAETRLKRGSEIGVLRGVHFVSEERGVAVGEAGVVVRTTDGGETWSRIAVGLDVDLNDVHFPTSQVGYIVGASEGGRYTILKTENGGASWARQGGVPEGANTLAGVYFPTPSMGVAVGFSPPSVAIRRGWVLHTTDGGANWSVPQQSEQLAPLYESVTLLEPEGIGYAAGSQRPISGTDTAVGPTVRRSEVGFDDDLTAIGFIVTAPSAETELTVTALHGLAAYWLVNTTPISLALDALESALAEGPSEAFEAFAESLELLTEALGTVADEIDDLRSEDDELEPVNDALGALAEALRALAQIIEEMGGLDQQWDEVREELAILLSTVDEEIQEAKSLLSSILIDAAAEIDDLRSEDDDLELVNEALGDLADALRSLGQTVEGIEVDPHDLTEHDQPVKVEVVHGVGTEAGFPIALLRPGGPHKTWALEPIESWEDHAGIALRDVSASPAGRTVVAVGDDGLILRRTTGANEVACVPDDLANSLEETLGEVDLPEGVPVCGDEAGERPDPEEREVEVASPPILELSPDIARPGSAITATGRNWLSCEEPEHPDTEPECRGSTVSVQFEQGGQRVDLGQVVADEDGRFMLSVTVPTTAAQGSALIRGVGDPVPDGGPSAEAAFTVVPVTPLSITLSPAGALPGEELRISGAGWHRCVGLDCEGVTVALELRQGKDAFDLGQVEASANGGFSNLPVSVPSHAKAGSVVIRARGNPLPDGGSRFDAPFDVLTECRITVAQTNPQFPCLRALSLDREDGERADLPDFLDFDPGLGESGRLVAVRGTTGGVRVFLYDTDRLKQRGVPGFGNHFEGDSRRGDQTGVVNLAHAGIEPSGWVGGASVQERGVALDTENHRLFIAQGEVQAGSSHRQIIAMSLVGEFPPSSFLLTGEPSEGITHLAVDGSSGVLYSATVLGGHTGLQHATSGTRDVRVRAIRTAVVGKGDDRRLVLGSPSEDGQKCPPHDEEDEEDQTCLPQATEVDEEVDSSWSLYVGDLCSTTANENLQFLGVGRDGRRLSLGCQGTDFFFFGFPQANPNGILTITLPPDVSPRDLTEGDAAPLSGAITRWFEPVTGGGMGQFSVHRLQGDRASGIMAWRAGGVFLVWDVNRAGWVASPTLEGRSINRGGNILAVDPASRRVYITGSEVIPDGHVQRMDVLNLPGGTEGTPMDTGLGSDLRSRDGDRIKGAFDPHTRRLIVRAGSHLRVLEDRTAPPVSRVELHPDRRTNDIDEEKASSVDRIGETAAYGARVWWTGLEGSLPGSYCVHEGGGLDLLQCANSPPGLTYSDVANRLISRGLWPPWEPHRDQREIFSARVDKGILESSDSALGFSSGLSEGEAWGIDTDGRKGETSGTGRDVRSRRSSREWHEEREELSRFDECFEEFYDRLLREVDGEREVHHTDPCFEEFDENDPDWNEEARENEREGLEQRAGLTQLSRCVDRGGEAREVSTTGSRVVCDRDGQSTLASAENALSVALPAGVSLDVDGSFSETTVFQDERGIVSEADAVASGVRLEIAGTGRLDIGEVLTKATTWANGRPGGAGSEYTVAYKDVQVSAEAGPDGAPGNVVVFSCDPHEDEAIVAGDTLAGDDLGSACDPEGLSDAIASVFGPRVTIQVPARDRDEIAEGTPEGAQALVRRHRTDFYNDEILFRVRRDELPGLSIQINADGALFNRIRIDLAAVYAESRYNIGMLAAPQAAPGMVEAPMADPRDAATVQVALVDPSGSPLENGTFELAHDGGLTAGCSTDSSGECELSPLPLGSYDLSQREAPPGYVPADPVTFELTQPGQVARITVVNGRGGRDGSDVVEIVEILEDARPAASTDGDGWWQRVLRGLPGVILNPWTVAALALITAILLAPGYLAARRRELSVMREGT